MANARPSNPGEVENKTKATEPKRANTEGSKTPDKGVKDKVNGINRVSY